MKRKYKLLIISLGTLSIASTLVSCSTSWRSWETNDGGNPNYPFPDHKFAPPKKYKIRSEKTLEQVAWVASTSTINLFYLNNQYELYALIGYVTKIKENKANWSIDQYWKYKNESGKPKWSDFQAYIKELTTQSIIFTDEPNKQNNAPSAIPVNINLKQSQTDILSGFANYSNEYIDYTKGPGLTLFHGGRAYDVGWHGLDKFGEPVDAQEVAGAGSLLITNPSVRSLEAFDLEFAFKLSKLVNIPKKSFKGFTTFMTSINKTLDEVKANPTFIKWKTNNNIDFHIMPNGIINPSMNYIDALKGGMLIELLKYNIWHF